MSSVPPFLVDPQRGADVQFHWPVGFGHGTYWFCANATSGSAPSAASPAAESFTVLTDAAPSVAVQVPSGGARADASITVTLSNWITTDGDTPEFSFVQSGTGSGSVGLIARSIAGSSNAPSGSYAYSVTLPVFYYPSGGTYAVSAAGECALDPLGSGKFACAVTERSAPFSVAPAPAPTDIALSTPIGTQISTQTGQPPHQAGIPPLVWLAGGVVVVVLALLLLLVLMRRAGIRSAYED